MGRVLSTRSPRNAHVYLRSQSAAIGVTRAKVGASEREKAIFTSSAVDIIGGRVSGPPSHGRWPLDGCRAASTPALCFESSATMTRRAAKSQDAGAIDRG